ncbi:WhiB family transcriptional regulator [Rhodococcus qingshengii]|uniref:WhiB family transcriptional regulator n=1 Tax=Rhodococcus qingshengii TaxID=334542 RepID=UPI001BE803B0|nr:WhiB family transcriptional regulator [Rhodococcus qingshengii]MBT2273469.1 WhiB family transcriptional regulator [Rhodococcus qingshengii]
MFSVVQLWEDEPGQWRAFARCRTEDSAIFFPPDGERPTARTVREGIAKRMCRSCPVRMQCLNFALSTGQQHGIWGTTTPPERHNLRDVRQDRDTASPHVFRRSSTGR